MWHVLKMSLHLDYVLSQQYSSAFTMGFLWNFYCFPMFFLRTFHALSMMCHGFFVYFAWLFCGVTMCGFTDPFNPFPMSNDSPLLYSLLYHDLYNISHVFHSSDINTRFILLFLSLFRSLLNSFPSHFSTRDILILFTSSDDVLSRAVYRYTKIILKCYKSNSAKSMCRFAWTWGSMDIAWLCSTHGVPCSIYAPW